jgi:hypothetical protein
MGKVPKDLPLSLRGPALTALDMQLAIMLTLRTALWTLLRFIRNVAFPSGLLTGLSARTAVFILLFIRIVWYEKFPSEEADFS